MDTYSYHQYGGCHFAYRMRGDGPPVLLIQGTGVHGDGWQPQVDGLAGRYRCLSFDNRGVGRSQPVGAVLSVAQMADDSRALLDAVGWESAHVVGHSLGGPIAIQLALQSPTRVRSLALLCTTARGRDVFPLTLRSLGLALRMQVGPRVLRRRVLRSRLAADGANCERARCCGRAARRALRARPGRATAERAAPTRGAARLRRHRAPPGTRRYANPGRQRGSRPDRATGAWASARARHSGSALRRDCLGIPRRPDSRRRGDQRAARRALRAGRCAGVR